MRAGTCIAQPGLELHIALFQNSRFRNQFLICKPINLSFIVALEYNTIKVQKNITMKKENLRALWNKRRRMHLH